MIFTPLVFPHLTVKNRIFRSSVAGRFDQYDGSGTQSRIFEHKTGSVRVTFLTQRCTSPPFIEHFLSVPLL